MLKLNVITGAHVNVGVLGNMNMPRLAGLAPSMRVGYHAQAHVTWAQIVFMFLGILNFIFFGILEGFVGILNFNLSQSIL
jgi:hypothetical protein